MTLEEFKALPPDQQQTTLREMQREAMARVRTCIGEELNSWEADRFEKELVPSIAFRPVEPQPIHVPYRPGENQDDNIRAIFRTDPSIKEIRCGDNIYTRR